MGMTITEKIISSHIVEGSLARGTEIGIKIDHILTQDATGTLVYFEFESMGIPCIKAELAASYVDHNLLQTDFKNADDHRYLRSVTARYGAYFSKPGGGISHQVHMERFSAPGKIMLGSDSHTSTNGAMGMIAIGAGGLDVAMAMSGYPFYLTMPKITGINLTGRLSPWVSAKDIILEMLRRYTVNGGVGKILEYYGPGVRSLSATDRATIANMGEELGCTTSVFPSDENTRYGRISDPRKLGEYPAVSIPKKFIINKEMIIPPPEDRSHVEIIRGPNIISFPEIPLLEEDIEGNVLLKVGDNITTDQIMPAGNEVLPLRSNIEAIIEFVYKPIDSSFARRAKEKKGGFIIGGENYGQGSSREHAALAPRYLGIRAKIAKSFARIHRANLINFGIVPLQFKYLNDYENITAGDTVRVPGVKRFIQNSVSEIPVYINGSNIATILNATQRERKILSHGGLMNYVKNDISRTD